MVVHKGNSDHNKYLEFALGECTQAIDEQNKKNNDKPMKLHC